MRLGLTEGIALNLENDHTYSVYAKATTRMCRLGWGCCSKQRDPSVESHLLQSEGSGAYL